MRLAPLVFTLALTLAGCGEPRPQRASSPPDPAAPATAPSPAGYFTVPEQQRSHLPARHRREVDVVDGAPHHRSFGLGQRPHDAGDHPGQQPESPESSSTPARG